MQLAGMFREYIVDQAGFIGRNQLFNIGHGKSDARFFTISVKRGKGGRTITTTVQIVMSTYPMDIPLIFLSSLQQLVCYCQMIKEMVFGTKFHGGTGMGNQL